MEPITVQKSLTRQEIAELLAEYERRFQDCPSIRQIAKELGIPRSTLQHWIERRDSIIAAPEVIAFFESSVGTAFLHRLVLGAHFVMTLLGPGSVRLVCQYLELTGLDQFVASSYCPQYKVSVKMEEAVNEFAKEEKTRLAEGMAEKQITVCQDETYHPEICLVAIEPVSNFILLEKYSENRKSKDWTEAMEGAVEGLAVEIVQSVSDEGSGILHHVKKELGAHHSPDVFHVQHEIIKGTSVALASKTERAVQAVDKASAEVIRCIKEKDSYLAENHESACPREFDKKNEDARKLEDEARRTLEAASAHQEQIRNAVQGISEAYHPFNLETGKLKTSEEVSSSLNACFSDIETTASEAGLSDKCLARIQKAKRVVVQMVATVVFYLLAIRTKVEALSLAPQAEQAIFENLIPAYYIHIVSGKTKCAEDREQLRKKSEELLVPILAPDGPFSDLNPEERALVERTAQECAELFQRSSSCVEGRNGQLSLRHHSLHRINDRKLSALTAVHNYVVKRSDGSTAAERLFGAKPKDMFEFLLSRVELPGWPAQKRL